LTKSINVVVSSRVPTIELKTVPVLTTVTQGEAMAIDKMTDVDASHEAQGDTLVYDVPSDKYIVRQLTFEELADGSAIDGGSF